MQNPPSLPPKPVAEVLRPELTRLPKYDVGRWLARRGLKLLEHFLIATRIRLRVAGIENFPRQGPALVVFNHLGDADIVVILSQLRNFNIDPLAASNLYDIPALRILAELYGVIWLHRGRPDRRALNCAIEALHRGRFVSIAPEGRESVAGGLERGLDGAAFLALRADVPIVPIGITGTENPRIYRGLVCWPRQPVSMTVGRPFRIERSGNRHSDIHNGTEQIMRAIARLLPLEYQGEYRQSETDPA